MAAKGGGPQNPAAAAGEHQCKSEDCKKKPDRAGFCNEHFAWFKWGLVTTDGTKARDFDKKYQGYMLSKNQLRPIFNSPPLTRPNTRPREK